ncbi:MAG: hypothetical protein KDB04_08210 [Acidimicrobiales bacterium]|nr:hypothetical protein [Acidimicrobiales bacterium]
MDDRPSARTAGRFAASTWAALDRPPGGALGSFDPGTLEGLPEPAVRLLTVAVPSGAELHRVVRLSMRGEISLGGRWMPFRATQVLRASVGLVWAPVVGGRLVRFVGADALGPDGARIEFRLHGRIPVVRGSGPDIARSAHGRLAAETVAWLPTALTPQAGARWAPRDRHRATVTLPGPGGPTDVEVVVDDDGALVELGLMRWNDAAHPPQLVPFGGSVDARFEAPGAVMVAGSGTVGWEWGTRGEADGRFFRYEITEVAFGASPAG